MPKKPKPESEVSIWEQFTWRKFLSMYWKEVGAVVWAFLTIPYYAFGFITGHITPLGVGILIGALLVNWICLYIIGYFYKRYKHYKESEKQEKEKKPKQS
ncbi:hypothetical protein H0N99_01015 [Candidatus Micrarchaeota archaeon]|nr:hypothetical protein [Candidatus Micrarchaeota archaeon]